MCVRSGYLYRVGSVVRPCPVVWCSVGFQAANGRNETRWRSVNCYARGSETSRTVQRTTDGAERTGKKKTVCARRQRHAPKRSPRSADVPPRIKCNDRFSRNASYPIGRTSARATRSDLQQPRQLSFESVTSLYELENTW